MQLLFAVDQASALKSGVNAPSSTVRVDIDPAELTQPERDYLATVLSDGHDCTRYGVTETGALCSGGRGHSGSLQLLRPDLQGVRDAIALRLRQREEYLAAEAARKLKQQLDADAKIAAAIAAPASSQVRVALREGRPTVVEFYYNTSPTVTIIVPQLAVSTCYASPEAVARFEAAKTELGVEVKRLIASTRPELERLTAAASSTAAERLARAEATTARLLAGVDAATLARREGGYCTDTDWISELSRVLKNELSAHVRDAGFSTKSPAYVKSRDAESLTDAQYARLVLVKEAATFSDAKVEVKTVYTDRRRSACDNHDEWCSDCDDCSEELLGPRAVALLTREVEVLVNDEYRYVTASVRVELGSLE